jgi:hypothetical protein
MDEIEKIVAAVKLRNGGFGEATEAQCLILWNALTSAQQCDYLEPAD